VTVSNKRQKYQTRLKTIVGGNATAYFVGASLAKKKFYKTLTSSTTMEPKLMAAGMFKVGSPPLKNILLQKCFVFQINELAY
jgi:hypothetical protein